MNEKPKRAKVKLTRTVTEIAMVDLDRQGDVTEVETLEELEYEVEEVHDIISVLDIHS